MTSSSSKVYLRRTVSRRASEFHSVAWSPDVTWVAAAGSDGCVWLFGLAAGESRLLEGHEGSVTSVAWSGDGRRLASGSLDNTVRVWEVGTGKAERVLEGHTGPVNSVAWS